MKRLNSQEIELIAQIIFDGKFSNKNSVYQRITWLRNNLLNQIAVDESGWEILYQDPYDHRYWELTFPNSEPHGGGPPKLSCVDLNEEIKQKYKI